MTARARDAQLARRLQSATGACYQTCLHAIRNDLGARMDAGAGLVEAVKACGTAMEAGERFGVRVQLSSGRAAG